MRKVFLDCDEQVLSPKEKSSNEQIYEIFPFFVFGALNLTIDGVKNF